MPPFAELMRPKNLEEFVGQEHLIGFGAPITEMIKKGSLASMIFWGPPAVGKTTLAHILSNTIDSNFYTLSAVLDGKEEFKNIIKEIKGEFLGKKQTNILFIDEIHRWNKAQQDALLSHVEKGEIILIGATTENPSFSINNSLLSRCRVFVFKLLLVREIATVLQTTCKRFNIQSTKENLEYIAYLADGDVRFALNTLEICNNIGDITREHIEQSSQKSLSYDKNGDDHFQIISALHKSMRSSNPTASAYWTMRMLSGGEDPLYVARRMLRFASEDIGNANPNALLLANQVFQATQNLGMPECETALVQLAEYLANSIKNNSTYKAVNFAKKDISKFGSLPVPTHLRNAPSKLMKDLGYGKEYIYDHDVVGKKSSQQCMPDELINQDYFKK